jgi:hypothetical protein
MTALVVKASEVVAVYHICVRQGNSYLPIVPGLFTVAQAKVIVAGIIEGGGIRKNGKAMCIELRRPATK